MAVLTPTVLQTGVFHFIHTAFRHTSLLIQPTAPGILLAKLLVTFRTIRTTVPRITIWAWTARLAGVNDNSYRVTRVANENSSAMELSHVLSVYAEVAKGSAATPLMSDVEARAKRKTMTK
jgi:hypothetical protein